MARYRANHSILGKSAMSSHNLFGKYLENPHSDLSYEAVGENDQNDVLSGSDKSLTDMNEPRILSDQIRLRPLPSRDASGPAAKEPSTNGTEISGKPEGSSIEPPPASDLIDLSQSPDQETEMNLDVEDHQNTTAGADEPSKDCNEKSYDEEMKSISADVGAIEQLIEDNFSSTIDETVQAALRNIVVRRAKEELSSITKSKKHLAT